MFRVPANSELKVMGTFSLRFVPEPLTVTPLVLIAHWLFCMVVVLPTAAFCQDDVSFFGPEEIENGNMTPFTGL